MCKLQAGRTTLAAPTLLAVARALLLGVAATARRVRAARQLRDAGAQPIPRRPSPRASSPRSPRCCSSGRRWQNHRRRSRPRSLETSRANWQRSGPSQDGLTYAVVLGAPEHLDSEPGRGEPGARHAARSRRRPDALTGRSQAFRRGAAWRVRGADGALRGNRAPEGHGGARAARFVAAERGAHRGPERRARRGCAGNGTRHDANCRQSLTWNDSSSRRNRSRRGPRARGERLAQRPAPRASSSSTTIPGCCGCSRSACAPRSTRSSPFRMRLRRSTPSRNRVQTSSSPICACRGPMASRCCANCSAAGPR